MFSAIIWDPNQNFFVIPYLNHPVKWYGFLFALAFLFSYMIVRKMFMAFLCDPEKKSTELRNEITLHAVRLSDRLAILVILGTVIGARLGYVFFYGWPYYKAHPLDIFKTWEGGLASHGGAVGILLALIIFVLWQKRLYSKLTFLTVLDLLTIPAALSGGLIRIGNFINQEITGIPTQLPWAVTFMHPPDGTPGVAVHPVQLYESFFYFGVFAVVLSLWYKMGKRLGAGLMSGIFFVLVFAFRFFIEFLKVRQSEILGQNSPLSMGQILSLPFILVGIALIIHASRKLRQRPA